jgi:phosphatidate cytidylyltransferase
MATPIIGIAFIVMFLTTISDETFTIRDVFYYFGMAIVLGLGFQSFYYLRYLPFAVEPNVYYDGGVYEYLASSMLFMYVVAGTMITDIGAYFFGVFFGKHKMNPRVSPKKTWEGFFGGIFVSVVFSIAYVFIADAAGCPILRGFLDIQHWYWVLLLSFAMPIIGNLGDLAFSAIKRDYNVKDYSNIIPGHGGVLDRIDSLLFTMPTVAILLMFITNGWQIIA